MSHNYRIVWTLASVADALHDNEPDLRHIELGIATGAMVAIEYTLQHSVAGVWRTVSESAPVIAQRRWLRQTVMHHSSMAACRHVVLAGCSVQIVTDALLA